MESYGTLLEIIIINLLLSGDNALVIALASRNLANKQRKAAMVWGGGGAILLRILIAFIAVPLLQLPYLKLFSGLLLLWIAIKLTDEPLSKTDTEIKAANNLWLAIKTILFADLIMSLDNVIAIIAVSKGNMLLLVIGLAISIPLIIWGSKAITVFIERWPAVITAGAAFLGWTAGEMAIADEFIKPYVMQNPIINWFLPGAFMIFVIFAGLVSKSKRINERGN